MSAPGSRADARASTPPRASTAPHVDPCAPTSLRALSPRAALRASISLLRQRPVAALLLGAALSVSLLSVPVGIGAVGASWFLCELFALQIGTGTGVEVRRTRSWLWAGAVQGLAVLVLAATLTLALLTIGPDLVFGSPRQPRGTLEQIALALGLLSLAGALLLPLTVGFEHAPALLIDREGGPLRALLESSWLTRESGLLRTWATSLVAHGLQLVPLAVSIIVLALAESAGSVPYWAPLLWPPVVIGLVLGQGMVVASYLHLRSCMAGPRVPVRVPSRAGALGLSLLLTSSAAGPVGIALALLRPSPLRVGPLAGDTEPELVLAAQVPIDRYVPGSALRLQSSARGLGVAASDGGGVGILPLPKQAPTSVRVFRMRPTGDPGALVLGIEIRLRNGAVCHTLIDEAGVRLDDSVSRRLALLLPPWAALALALSLAWLAFWICVLLPREAQPLRDGTQGSLPALRASLWLLPASLTSLGLGIWALSG